ncbi:hypothetical protein Desti_1439 [Desulfomonile tiedjei DSM 6799]|uniref:HEAT repeat domain-containing protein n=2 Tax=Desulfomonile tiedjei TaxID=2358 RepID=I4C3L0_DESTA|nr:hypothetical protein Desti_1439 [Desulfomonile tiedjei DSM 6799]
MDPKGKKMKRMLLCAILLLFSVGTVFAASDASIDRFIQELKSNDSAVRAKAAHELGCG